MSRGLTQLAAEMIALDMTTSAETPLIYGAVSVGDIWRFGVLDRARKMIQQDIAVFTIPDNMEELMAVLMGIVRGETIRIVSVEGNAQR